MTIFVNPTDIIVNHPLRARPVYGIHSGGGKTQIGTIACVTPEEWVMYFSDARWRFISCIEGVPSSTAGTMRECEEFVYGLVEGVAAA